MPLSLARRISLVLRVFTALNILMLLTLVVPHREDHDGYQATHLYFMPRDNWEMDEGRGMLYEEEHYRRVEQLAAAKEFYGEPLRAADHEELQAGQEQYEEWADEARSKGPRIKGKPHVPNLSSNEIPVAALALVGPLSYLTLFELNSGELSPVAWTPDVLTPPPRLLHFSSQKQSIQV